MKIAGAAADRLGQLLERRFLLALFDQPACPRENRRVCGVQREAVRLAALAGAEARSFRALQRVVELNVLRLGGARRALRAAIDASGHDGIPEMTVCRLVAGDDLGPTRVIRYGDVLRFLGFCKKVRVIVLHLLLYDDLGAIVPLLAPALHSAPCFQIQS